MPTAEGYKEQIAKELALAEASRKQENEGRARVCARRAVGIAIVWFYSSMNIEVKEIQSVDLLRRIQGDDSFPWDVQQAASRLSARITSDFQYASPTDPLADARLIIECIMKAIA